MGFFDDLPIFGPRLVKDDPKYVRTKAQRQARREKGMAGSYNHVIDEQGNLLSNDRMMISGAMIENLGDAYEAIEEMYGMIWWLANRAPGPMPPEDLVEKARQGYTVGLQLAKQNTDKKKFAS